MSTGKTLSTTSYAVLGLLAVRPSSTYELTRQMDRTVGRFWPRAASKLYEEPKKLVALGLAEAAADSVGRRPRTIYSITPAGRAALAEWLGRPGAGPVLEFEQLLKVFLADSGSRADTLATLAAAARWAAEQNTDSRAAAEAYLQGRGPYPERAAQNLLVGAFLTDFYALVARWAGWAGELVDRWPDDPRAAELDRAALADVVRRAGWEPDSPV